MQRRHLIWSGGLVGVVALVACRSIVPAASAESERAPGAVEADQRVAMVNDPAPGSVSRPVVSSRSAKARPAAVDAGFDVGQGDIAIDPETGFAVAAFPPTIPDREWHVDAWLRDDCMSCHETGVGEAPMVRHRGLPEIAVVSKCRSCHVLIPGKTAMVGRHEKESLYLDYAFPPMLPNNANHAGAWNTDSCLLCHENGVRGAPIVKHATIPAIAMTAKCRTCHVQVRSIESP